MKIMSMGDGTITKILNQFNKNAILERKTSLPDISEVIHQALIIEQACHWPRNLYLVRGPQVLHRVGLCLLTSAKEGLR